MSEDVQFILGGEERDRIVLQRVKKDKSIIYGSRAVNSQVMGALTADTRDYDIYDKTPNRSAHRLERSLDRNAGYNAYTTRPALHKGTSKVVFIKSQTGVADYTKPKGPVQFIIINGVRYRRLDVEKQRRQEILRDPKSKYRWAKDKDAIHRISLSEWIRRKMNGQ